MKTEQWNADYNIQHEAPTLRHALLQEPPTPTLGFTICAFIPQKMEPGLRPSSATALRQLSTDKWPPLPLSHPLSNASEPQNGPLLLSYSSSIFINCNPQESPRVQNVSFQIILKAMGEKDYVLMELLWLKQGSADVMTSHTDRLVMLQ